MAESESDASSGRFFSGEENPNPSEHSLPDDESDPSEASDKEDSQQGDDDVGVPIPDAAPEVEIHHEVVMVPGLVGFDDFDDDDDLSDDWEGDDTDDASIDWEMIQQEFSGDDSDEGSDQSYETDGLPEDGIPRICEPYLLEPTSFVRYSMSTSNSHHQVADALCSDGGSCELPGHQEILTYCEDRIRIRRLSPDGNDAKILFEERIKPLEAAFIQPVKPFSIARTDDGRFIAIAAEIGFVYIKEIERVLPQAGLQEPAASSNSFGSSLSQAQNLPTSSGGVAKVAQGGDPKDQDIMYKQKSEHIFVMSDSLTMANSVRFGLVGGKMRLMVGCQTKSVVFFELPDANAGLPAVTTLCPNQEETCHIDDDANAPRFTDVVHLTERYIPDAWLQTAAISGFDEAVNYVETSKDGRWLAVCLDLGYAMLLDERDRYQLSRAKTLRYDEDDSSTSTGSHYCSFSPTGEYLVTTSDKRRGAVVWHTDSGELLFTVPTKRPSLPVRFLDATVFAFAEAEKRVHILDISCHERAHQIMNVPISTGVHRQSRITGLSTVKGRLLVSTTDQVLSYQSLPSKAWSRERHQFYPEPFKALVKVMVMGSRVDIDCDLYKLPPANVEDIIRIASSPIGHWFPAKSQTSN